MVGLALLGAGRIGRVHADSLAAHPRAEFRWIYDAMAPAAQQVADQYGARVAPDVDAVLADDAVDAVVIAAPTPTHVDLMTRAVQAGKAVLCEKPIDLDLARVDECWAAIGSSDPTVMIGFNRRFDPSFKSIRDQVREGAIGRLEQLVIISRDPAPPPVAYIGQSGGLFRDMTIHDFDMARFFLGDIVEVQAAGANLISDEIKQAGDIDSAVVVLRGADGALASITNSRRCSFGYDQRLEAFGEKAMLSAANQLPTSVTRYDDTLTGAAPPFFNFFLDRYTPAYRAELDHFISSVENGTAPDPGFRDGREALVLADAANESLRTGRSVRINQD